MESKQVQTCSIIWNYSSYKAPVISPRTKYNWHCAIGFLILFFRKEYILFSNVYISVNMIFECCYFFWLRNRPPIKYVRNWRNGGGSPKICTGAYREKGVSHLMCTYALTDNYSFHVFVLRCLVLTFIKKGVLLYIFGFFLERISCTSVCLKLLCNAKLIISLLIL